MYKTITRILHFLPTNGDTRGDVEQQKHHSSVSAIIGSFDNIRQALYRKKADSVVRQDLLICSWNYQCWVFWAALMNAKGVDSTVLK